MDQSLIRKEIQELRDRDELVTLEEYSKLRMNSWERESIIPNLNNEAFANVADTVMNNTSPKENLGKPSITYDEVAIYVLLPEAIQRIRKLEASIDRIINLGREMGVLIE